MFDKSNNILKVDVLYLDELGYGPEGLHTRRKWRDESLRHLKMDSQVFLEWQTSLLKNNTSHKRANYAVCIYYTDGSSRVVDDFYDEFQLDFRGLESDYLDLRDYKFVIETSFVGSVFKKTVMFERTVFYKFTYFGDTTFLSSAYFESVNFKNGAIFNNTNFHGEADFKKSLFEGGMYFLGTKFHSDVKFDNSNFDDLSSFVNSTFESKSSFNNVVFKKVGFFDEAKFKTSYPSFFSCAIDSTRLEFGDESCFPNSDKNKDSIKKISFLKRVSDEHGQLDQALDFNAMELRAKRQITWLSLVNNHSWSNSPHKVFFNTLLKILYLFEGRFWFCVFTLLYEKVSDFGRSYTRPMFFLMLLITVSYLFGIVSAFENSPSLSVGARKSIFSELSRVYIYEQRQGATDHINLSGYRAAMEYSLYRSANFLDFTDSDKNTASINMRLFGNEIEPWWARLFGLVKGIFTAILLFLIALGLRNKYRVS